MKMFKSKKPRIKILLVQIANRHYGDTAISDNARFLINKGLRFRNKDSFEILDYNILLSDTEQIKYVDAVVFAGGGVIKYKNEEFDKYTIEIIEEAEKYSVPVFFNAVGVEGFDGQDERCLALKQALNYSCVKSISIRDDMDTMQNGYIERPDIRVKSVVDPAVWSDKVYTDDTPKTEYIGLGVAREKLFSDYGIQGVDREYLLEFWKEVANKLEAEGLKWKIFTNGLNSDEAFANEVLEYIGHGEKVAQPQNVGELVKTIKSFKGIIACRMHTNIVAYSFRVPSIGLVWNDKLTFWGEKSGYPERYITYENLTPENTVEALKTALKKGCSRVKTTMLKRKTYRELKRFVKSVTPLNAMKKSSVNYKNRMLATALGGMDFKYNNTNCLEALSVSAKSGYRFFETDVRLTKDGKLVCVNGWHKDTFKKLGLEYTDESKLGLEYDEFIEQKYYGFFDTVDFDSLLDAIKPVLKDKTYKLIIDVGLPKKELIGQMFDDMINALKQADVKLFKSKEYPAEIAYFIALPKNPEQDLNEHFKKIIAFCKAEKIELITLANATYSDELQKMLDKAKLKSVVMTYTKTEDIIGAIESGVYLVGSHYYTPEYLNRLTR